MVGGVRPWEMDDFTRLELAELQKAVAASEAAPAAPGGRPRTVDEYLAGRS